MSLFSGKKNCTFNGFSLSKIIKLSILNLSALITFDEFKKMGEKDTKREQEALNQAALVQCQIGKNMEDSTKKD